MAKHTGSTVLAIENNDLCNKIRLLEAELSTARSEVELLTRERDELGPLLRQCAGHALITGDGISDELAAEQTMLVPLEKIPDIVNDRICDLECSESQLHEQLSECQRERDEANKEIDRLNLPYQRLPTDPIGTDTEDGEPDPLEDNSRTGMRIQRDESRLELTTLSDTLAKVEELGQYANLMPGGPDRVAFETLVAAILRQKV